MEMSPIPVKGFIKAHSNQLFSWAFWCKWSLLTLHCLYIITIFRLTDLYNTIWLLAYNVTSWKLLGKMFNCILTPPLPPFSQYFCILYACLDQIMNISNSFYLIFYLAWVILFIFLQISHYINALQNLKLSLIM